MILQTTGDFDTSIFDIPLNLVICYIIYTFLFIWLLSLKFSGQMTNIIEFSIRGGVCLDRIYRFLFKRTCESIAWLDHAWTIVFMFNVTFTPIKKKKFYPYIYHSTETTWLTLNLFLSYLKINKRWSRSRCWQP